MEIRRLKPEEHVQYSGISQTVFFDIERRDIREMSKNPLEHTHDGDSARFGVFDGKGRLQSAVLVVPFTMRMNGREVKMGGIGGVVTRPEARGRGHIRRLMEVIFPAMLEAGQAFSFLYPFSFEYYRKFGYEMCYPYQKVRVPISQLGGYPFPKRIEPHEPGDSAAPFAEIYESFTRGRNLAIVRDGQAWEKILDRDPYKDLQFTYLHYDERGRPDAYILYGVQRDDGDGNRVMVKECCWSTAAGLRGIFGYAAKLSAEFEYLCWNAPCDVNIHALLPEGYELRWRQEAAGMNRLVDVPAALAALRAPRGSGRVAVAVADAFWPGNSGVYSIAWEGGGLEVEKRPGAAPDLTTTAETLAQLVTGYLTPAEAIYKKDTAVHGAHTRLAALFPKQRLYIMERF